jgi:pimeloyl-ACP methyl ester carboxylesterase
VCAYDRPGLGTSEQTPQPRLPLDIIATLHALLNAAAGPPPYVIVGHSWGGEIARLYAMRFPSEIVGLVLVDSSHEDQVRRFAAVTPPASALGNAPPSASAPAPPRELADLAAMGAELSKNPWHANVPLVVLTRTPPADPAADPRMVIWQELQSELATRSPRAEHIIATQSGHYIQNHEPLLVIDAVRRALTNPR